MYRPFGVAIFLMRPGNRFARTGIFLLIGSLLFSCSQYELRPEMVIVRTPEDVVPVDSTQVKPVVYHNECDLNTLSPEEKKQKFISMILPEILMVKHNIRQKRQRIGHIIYLSSEGGELSDNDSSFMAYYMDRLRAKSWEEVYRKMSVHPTSIVIAQAAVESGWGSSRFFSEGNNLFGVWSFDAEESRIKASRSRETGSVYVRSYETIGQSIEDYFYTLARGRAYINFRHARVKEKDPYKLIFHLKSYSELGYQYVNKLALIMRQNDLDKYDLYELNSTYIKNNEMIVF